MPREVRLRILVVDDDEAVRDSLALVLRSEAYAVDTARDGEEALSYCAKRCPDLVICDLAMPGKGGLETLRELRSEYPRLGVICLSGGGGLEMIQPLHVAQNLGAIGVVEKPISIEELLGAVKEAIGGGDVRPGRDAPDSGDPNRPLP